MGKLDVLIPGEITLDSREVAKMVNKRHDHLIRDIGTYVNQMEEANKLLTPTLGAVNEESPKLGASNLTHLQKEEIKKLYV